MFRYVNFRSGWIASFLVLALTFISFQSQAYMNIVDSPTLFTHTLFDSGTTIYTGFESEPMQSYSLFPVAGSTYHFDSAIADNPNYIGRGQVLQVKHVAALGIWLLGIVLYTYRMKRLRPNDANGGSTSAAA